MFREILPKMLSIILKIFKKNFGRFRELLWRIRKVIGIQKFRGNFYVLQNSKETDICSKILRKFKGTVRKLLKQAILRKFFVYFGNIFRNNCVKFQVNARKITIVGNSRI